MKTPEDNQAAVAAKPPKHSAPNNIPVLLDVALNQIEPDPKNRDKIGKDDVAKMAASIQAVGLLQPIVLRELGGGRYRIIAGEHRFRAYQQLKALTIRAMIYKDQSDLDAAKKKAVENAQRVDLTPIERAKRFRELGELGAKQGEIGELFGGLSQPVVANALRLLELPAHVQALLSSGDLSEAHGVSLARFAAWPAACNAIASRALKEEITSKDLNEEDLPYAYELVRAGLAYAIETNKYYQTHYVLPPEFLKDPGFFDGYYLKPADPKADKWIPLKAKLDAERAAKAASADKKEGAKQSKMSPAAAAARRKVIADNKQARRESALAHAAVFKQLAETKEIDAACLAVVAQKAFAYHWGVRNGIAGVAKALGIAWSGSSTESLDKLAKLKPVDLLRLVAGCILQKESDDAVKFGHEIHDEVAHVLGAKKAKKIKQAAADQLAAVAKAKAAKKKGGAK